MASQHPHAPTAEDTQMTVEDSESPSESSTAGPQTPTEGSDVQPVSVDKPDLAPEGFDTLFALLSREEGATAEPLPRHTHAHHPPAPVTNSDPANHVLADQFMGSSDMMRDDPMMEAIQEAPFDGKLELEGLRCPGEGFEIFPCFCHFDEGLIHAPSKTWL